VKLLYQTEDDLLDIAKTMAPVPRPAFADECSNFTDPCGPVSGVLSGVWRTQVGLGGLRYAQVGS
jgi:hypothetical protein